MFDHPDGTAADWAQSAANDAKRRVYALEKVVADLTERVAILERISMLERERRGER